MSENENSKKDNWDKCKIVFDIAIKFVEVVFLIIVAIFVKNGADKIAQSLEKGKLVQAVAEQLVASDAKRDIALIALSEAMPSQKIECTTSKECEDKLKHDQVFRIAVIVANSMIKNASNAINLQPGPKDRVKVPDDDEINVAREIIEDKTNKDYYAEKFGKKWSEIQGNAQPRIVSNPNKNYQPTTKEIEEKSKKSEIAIAPTITNQQDLKLKGIRIVYIQYRSDKTKAEAIQKALQDEKLAAPGIQKIDGIKENSIRYANSSDRSLAENLRNFLKSKTGIGIQIEDKNLIDLSNSNYRVPSGQLEVWLKD